MRSHQYPEPWWRPDGSIEYAPNAKEAEKLKAQGYRLTPVTFEFPRAVFGGILRTTRKDHFGNEIEEFHPQTLSVKNQDELERALKSGWKLKPVVVEAEETLPPSPDRPPVGFEIDLTPAEESEAETITAAAPAARRGRPPKEQPAA
jgi:hypothetical protein